MGKGFLAWLRGVLLFFQTCTLLEIRRVTAQTENFLAKSRRRETLQC